jgi:hypothetical protein
LIGPASSLPASLPRFSTLPSAQNPLSQKNPAGQLFESLVQSMYVGE